MISFIIYFTECLHMVRMLKLLILPWGALLLSHSPNICTTLRTKKLLVTPVPLVGKMMPQTCGTFWKITTRHIRRFKYFQKAVVMMFWYLEHWWILYLKQPHKLRCYVIALMILCQQTISTLCSYSLEASSVHRDEIVGNLRGDLRQPRQHFQKEEFEEGFSRSIIPVHRLHQHLMSQKKPVLKVIRLL